MPDQTTASVSIYSITTKTWKVGPNMIQPRWYLARVSAQTILFMQWVAMMRVHTELSSCEMLRCDENGEPIGAWQTLPPMKKERSEFRSCLC